MQEAHPPVEPDGGPVPADPEDHLTAEDLMVFEPREIAVPGTGELVLSDDPQACANALDALRAFERQVGEAKRALTEAIAEQSRVLGTKTIPLADGRKAVLRSGTQVEYDAEQLEVDLRKLGMPEPRIREVVRENVSYSVVAVEAKRAAGANPAYAEAVARNSREVERPEYVSIVR